MTENRPTNPDDSGFEIAVPPAADAVPPSPDATPPSGNRRNLWLTLGITAGVLVLCCVVGAVGMVTWGIYENHRSQKAAGRVGDKVRDGRLTFRVNSVTCNVSQVGTDFAFKTAAGQFCVVDLSVANTSDQPVLFSDAWQKAFNPAGDRYGPDTTAGLLANPDQQTFLSALNPGNSVEGAVVYDIPRSSSISKLELHESANSRGVTVKV